MARDICEAHLRVDCLHCHFYRLPHGPVQVTPPPSRDSDLTKEADHG